jgi:gentisate 1,2-dioxygenase
VLGRTGFSAQRTAARRMLVLENSAPRGTSIAPSTRLSGMRLIPPGESAARFGANLRPVDVTPAGQEAPGFFREEIA